MNARLEMPVNSREPRVVGTAPAGSAARELLQQLAELYAGLRELDALAGRKLAALRSADTAALHACASEECEQLTRIFRAQPQRNAAIARVAQSLPGCDPAERRLEELAARLPEPLASALRARNAALQEVAGELQRKNRMAAEVAQNLQTHIREIFAAVAGATQESLVYGPQGQRELSSTRCWVDAVG